MTDERSETTNGVVEDRRPEPPAGAAGDAVDPSTSTISRRCSWPWSWSST